MTGPNRVAWHRRLSVRLTAILAVTLLLFDWVAPSIFHFLFDQFGLPPHTAFVTEVSPEELAELERDGEFLPGSSAWDPTLGGDATFNLDATAHIEALLVEAVRLPSGGLQPTQRAIATVGEELDLAFAWTDRDLNVLAVSRDSDLVLGEFLDVHSTDHVHGLYPFEEDGAVLGWLALFCSDTIHEFVVHSSASSFGWPDGIEDEVQILEPEELERATQRMQWLGNTIYYGLTALTALLMSMVVSRLITARLSRLAREASESGKRAGSTTSLLPSPGTAGLAPFDERGSDEIAMLAGALNGAWGRVQFLMQELDERDEQRREWIAQVSHDMRTPLTALFACLERAKAAVHDLPEGERSRALVGILDVAALDAERVRALADDLLEIARLDSQEPLNLESVLPGEIVERAVAGLRPLASSRDVLIETHVAMDLPSLHADGHRLMRVLENLLRNAIEHAASRIDLRMHCTENHLELECQDDGPGFPTQDGAVRLDQLTSAATATPGSSGIGLVVVDKIVDRHGGQVVLDNHEAGGARIRITLPLEASTR